MPSLGKQTGVTPGPAVFYPIDSVVVVVKRLMIWWGMQELISKEEEDKLSSGTRECREREVGWWVDR